MAKIAATLHDATGARGRTNGIYFGGIDMPRRMEPIVTPLPRVAGDVVKAVTIACKRIDRAGGGEAIIASVHLGKFALPNITEVLAVWSQLITPGINLLLKATARCIFPFRFGRQPLACPLGIGTAIGPRYMSHRIVLTLMNAGMRTFCMHPIGTWNLAPPFNPLRGVLY